MFHEAEFGAGHDAYTDRFHKLARLVPHLVTPESRMIERNGSLKKVEKKGNMEELSKDKSGRDDNKRTRTGNVFATAVNPVGRENIEKDCRGMPRNVNPVNAINLRVRACYKCGSTDHILSACPRWNRAQGPRGNRPNQVVDIQYTPIRIKMVWLLTESVCFVVTSDSFELTRSTRSVVSVRTFDQFQHTGLGSDDGVTTSFQRSQDSRPHAESKRYIHDESLFYQSLPQISDVQALPQKNMFNKIDDQYIGLEYSIITTRPNIGLEYSIITTRLRTRIETIVYADSDHAGDYVDHKSTSGICTFMGCYLTSWFARKQTALAISTIEAECVSAEKAFQQALWMKQALIDYGIRLDDVSIMCDNKGVESFKKVDSLFSSIKVMKVCLIKDMGCMLWNEGSWIIWRSNEIGKVKVLRVLEMMEHDSRACIYGAFISVNTNDIFSNNEFPILDVGRKIISKD
nr:retrovirus-related Pol polyprotein from transposon TNT 1-94 [Tanacetum cinerariifolium]